MDLLEVIMVNLGVEEKHAENIIEDCKVYIDRKKCNNGSKIVQSGQVVSIKFDVE